MAADAQGLTTIWANDNCPKAGKVYGDRFGKQTKDELTRLASQEDIDEAKESFLDTDNWLELEKHTRKFPGWGIAVREKFCGCDLTRFSEAVKLVPLKSLLPSNVSGNFDLTESTTIVWR